MKILSNKYFTLIISFNRIIFVGIDSTQDSTPKIRDLFFEKLAH